MYFFGNLKPNCLTAGIIGFFIFFCFFGVVLADTDTNTYYPTADGSTESANWKSGSTACTATNCYDEMDLNVSTEINNTASGDESFAITGLAGPTVGATITSVDVTFTGYYTETCAGAVNAPNVIPFVRLNGTTNYSGVGSTLTGLSVSYSETINVGAAWNTGDFEIGLTYTDGSCPIARVGGPSYASVIRSARAAGEDVKGFVSRESATNIVYTPGVSSTTISGTVYADKGVTATSSTVKVVVNGTTASSTSAAANGTYSVKMAGISAGTPITIYLDNGTSTKAGATVIRYSGSGAVTGANVYNKTLITRHDDSTAINNANLSVCDKTTGSACADTDLHYDVVSGTLTVDNDWDLFVWSGDTFAPGGDIVLSTGGSAANIYVTSSAAMTMATSSLSIPTPAKFTMTGTGIFSQTTGTTTVQSTGIFAVGNSNKVTFGNYVASSGTHTIQASTTIAGILTIKSGATFQTNSAGGTPRLTLSGTGTVVANSGTFNLPSNTEVQYTGSSATIDPSSGQIITLILGSSTASGTYTAGGALSLSTLQIASSTGVNTFNGGSVTSSMSIFSVGTNGAFTGSSSTIKFAGSINMTVPALTYWNLTVGGNSSAVSSTLAGNITVQNVLRYANNTYNETFNLGSYTITLSGSGTPFVNESASSHILKTASSTVNYTGTSATNITTTTYWNLGVGTTNDASGVTYTALGNINVTNQMTIGGAGSSATDILSMGSYTMTLDGAISSGVQSPLAVTAYGAVSTSTGTIKYTKSGAKVAPTSYFNLTVQPSSGDIYIATSTGKTLYIYGTSTFDISGTSGYINFGTYNPSLVFYGDVSFSGCPEVCGGFTFGSGTFTFSPTGTKTFTNNYGAATNFGNFILSGGASTPILTLSGNTLLTSFTIASGHTLSSASSITATSHFQGAGTATFSAGTVTMSGTAFLGGAGSWTFNSLTISSSTTASSTGGMTVNGILTIGSGGTLYAGSKTWTLASSGTPFVKTGTFNADNSTTTYTASAATNITSATYANLALNGTATFTAAGAITASSTFTHANGTFDLSTSNYALTVNGNYTRTGGAGFNMRGSTITVSGNWNSSGVATDYNNASTTVGTSTVVMNGSGTKTITTGATSAWLTRFYNLNVAQGAGKTTQLQQTFAVKNILTIGAGILDINSKSINLGTYGTDSGANPLSIDPSATVGLGNGSLSFVGSNMTQYIPAFNYNTAISIDGMSGLTVTQTGAVTTTLYLYVGAQCLGRAVTWDTGGYNLGVGSELRMQESSSTLTLRGSTVTVGTNWTNGTCIAGSGGTVNAGTSTVVFNATATGKTIVPGGKSFNNVTFSGSGGGWVFTSSTTVGGDLTMTAGTLSGTSTITVSGGDVTGNGTISITGGTFNMNGTGNFGGTTAWTFGNLTFGGTTTAIGSGGINATGTLTISGSSSLNAGGKTWTLLGAGTPFVTTGTFTPATSTIFYGAASASTVTATNYYNLQVGSSTATTVYTLGGNTTVGGALTINNSSGINGLAASSYTLTFASSGTVFVINENGASSTAFQAGTGTVNFTGAGTTTIPALTYYHLGVKPSSTNSHQFAAGTFTIGGDFTAGDGTHTGTVDASPNSTTLSVTGNMVIATSSAFKANASNALSLGGSYTNNGTLVHNNGTVTFTGSGSPTLSGAMTGGSAFYNLTLNGSGTFTAANAIGASSTFTHANGTFDLGTGNNNLTITGNYIRTGGNGFNMRAATTSVGGNWDSSGVVNDYDGASTTIGTATVVMTGGAAIVTTGSGSTWRSRFYNLNFKSTADATLTMGQSFGVRNVLTLETNISTLDLNSKTLHLGQSDAASNANPLSLVASSEIGTGNGIVNFFGNVNQNIPGHIYNVSAIMVDNSAGITVTQTGAVTTTAPTASLYIGSNWDSNRKATWDTGGYSLSTGNVYMGEASSTLTLNTSKVYVGGDWNMALHTTTGGTVNKGTSEVVFNATDSGNVIRVGSVGGASTENFYDITFNGSGGVWSFATDTVYIARHITVTNGTVDNSVGSANIQIGGLAGNTIFGCGITCGTINFNAPSHAVIWYVSQSATFGPSTGTESWTFRNLTTSCDGCGGSHEYDLYFSSGGTGAVQILGTWTMSGGVDIHPGGRQIVFLGTGTPFSNGGDTLTFDAGTSTVVYAGATTGTIVTAETYYNLQVGTSTATSTYTLGGNTTVGGALTINNSSNGTNGLAASSYTLTFASSGTVFVISENGPNTTAFQSGTGTVNFTGAGTTTISAATYYHLGVKPSSTNSHQFAAGTFIIGGDFTAGDGTHTGMVDASPNSSPISVTGSMTVAASGVFKANAANSISIGGNYTNSGTLVHNSGQFTFNGSSQQTLSGNLSGGSAFSRLVFSNNSGTLSSPAIILSTSTQTAATSTIVTASTTVRFAAGQTYTFDSLNWNGQATTSRVGLRSSSDGTQWYLNVDGAKSVQNVNVRDSNACGSSANISVGNDTVDSSGNNSCWDWPLPGTPGTPTFPYVSSTWIVVNWTEATDATYYNLYRAPNSGGPYAFIASTTLTSSTNTGLTPGTTYWYEVVGANGTGVGPTSSAASATTLTVSQGYATSASLTSVIYDTAATGGVAPNSITWQGTRPVGTTVKFQIAGSATTTGSWTYTAWNGSGSNDPEVACDTSSYYPRTGTSEPNTAVELKAVCQQNKRYLRYKLFLESTSSSTTPTVTDIILNYAR